MGITRDHRPQSPILSPTLSSPPSLRRFIDPIFLPLFSAASPLPLHSRGVLWGVPLPPPVTSSPPCDALPSLHLSPPPLPLLSPPAPSRDCLTPDSGTLMRATISRIESAFLLPHPGPHLSSLTHWSIRPIYYVARERLTCTIAPSPRGLQCTPPPGARDVCRGEFRPAVTHRSRRPQALCPTLRVVPSDPRARLCDLHPARPRGP